MAEFESVICARNGEFPGNEELEVCILKQVFPGAPGGMAERFEELFANNGWPPAWRNGLYDFHHFHSTAHEALGVYSGWVEACFGGPGGPVFRAGAGDVIVIPAGVSHQNVGQSPDFRVVGAYPSGQRFNMRYGNPGEFEAAAREVAAVELPARDPVFGSDGPVMECWNPSETKKEGAHRL